MIFYTAINDEGRTVLCGTQAEAKAVNKIFGQIDIPVTPKSELMTFVQDSLDTIFALSSGQATKTEEPVATKPAQPPSYSDISIAIEDSWQGLPLAQKLHFAALAMEEARDTIKPPKGI